MGNYGLVVLEHEHQEHLTVVSLDMSRQDEYLVVNWLGTTADDKEDGSDSLDDKVSSVSFDYHRKTQMARSFSC